MYEFFLVPECEAANIRQDDLSLTTPVFPFPATANPAVTQDLTITAHANGSNVFVWYVNNQTFRANYK